MSFQTVLANIALATCLVACAGKPPVDGSMKTSFAASAPVGSSLKADDPVALSPVAWMRPRNPAGLAGRDIYVSSADDIALANKEVVLSFDDGPVPGKTESILATLEEFGVKATFLMVGEMAQAHPDIAKKVIADGHSVGSHTYSHPNLRALSFDRALAEVSRGASAVSKATDNGASFFRFPYLADNGRLRHMVSDRGMVIMDVQIDSKDYFKDAPAVVASRTMAALRHRGSGIILMHDIHRRTAAMLPALLTQLRAEGYKVVHLVYKKNSHKPMVVASLN
ncbi:polysaccharide deacetylase family protein [Rhizobium skierniewicense]|uniref:polysaccharide deacetylase family protein n=1 Tax=Rhizobium TaxID=379 RepID=UPI001FAD0652|nr:MULTISPECIES: polysaccharide deacetylase family protein [Rhizobium]MCI9865948.1 polysaccharide deacetylase family protein [Rhizobium skierniewicense]